MQHEYAHGKTRCQGKWYKTGFAPCEISTFGEAERVNVRALMGAVNSACTYVYVDLDGDVCGMAKEAVRHQRRGPNYDHRYRASVKPKPSDADIAALAALLGLDRCPPRRDVNAEGDLVDAKGKKLLRSIQQASATLQSQGVVPKSFVVHPDMLP